MTREEVFAKLNEVFRDVFDDEDIVVTDETTAADIEDWDSLPADERKLYARQMETFAGYLSETDHEIGRLVDFLRRIDQLDNSFSCRYLYLCLTMCR